MDNNELNRIADALERIAKVMENEERRNVNQGLTERRKARLIKEVQESLSK